MYNVGLTLAIALAAGVLAQSLSRQLRLPGIVLLLGVGVLLGPEGAGFVNPDSFGEGIFDIVDFGIAIILFEGGLNLQWSRLKRQEASIRRLITIGAVITFIGSAGLALAVLGWSWDLSLLFGSLVVVTGPTVVAPLLRDMRLRPRLRTILEAEGVLIDPLGVLLAVSVLQVVTRPSFDTLAHEAGFVVASLGFGLVAGLMVALMLVLAIRYRILVARGFEQIFTLAIVILLFEACNSVVEESGLMAVTVAGIVIGNVEIGVGEELREFKDRLTILLVGMLFVLLTANVALVDVITLGKPGLILVAGLVLIVRPFSVWAATRGLSLSISERVFVASIAPRGIVAAAVASLTVATLKHQGVTGGEELVALVFLVIATTVIVSGVIAQPLAAILGLRLPKRDRVLILGARGLAICLANELKGGGVDVTFLESDPKRSRLAEEAGYMVVFGDPLDERTMLRTRPELVGKAIGLTFSEHFNSLFIRQAIDRFDIPRGLIALDSLFIEQVSNLIPQEHGDVLFDGPHDHERWDVRWRHKEISVCRFVYEGQSEMVMNSSLGLNEAVGSSVLRSQELYVILSIERAGQVIPMRMNYHFRKGDIGGIAIFAPEIDNAKIELERRGWSVVEMEPETC